MGAGNTHRYREIIERYCNVIGENTAIFRTSDEHAVTYECLNKHRCIAQRGACQNEKYRPR